jgi:8-oxo-dGTP diphosphatase
MIADQINYCPLCGAAVIQATHFGRIRPSCPQCHWIYFADPKVAAAILVMHGDQVLLVRRANEPQRGHWSLPAGFVDAGEDPAQAAARECHEETGLLVQVTGLLDVIAGQEHPRGANILIVYQGEITSGLPRPGDDADSVAFFSLDNLPPLAFKATEIILNSFPHQ